MIFVARYSDENIQRKYTEFWSIVFVRKETHQNETRYININVDGGKKTIFMINISDTIYMSF